MSPTSKKTRKSGGRPAKFTEPSRPITVTLPVRILEKLKYVDEDRAIALTKAVEAATDEAEAPLMQVELTEMGAGNNLLLVPPNRSLRHIPWLKLIEVTPTRYLLTVTSGTSLEKLELALIDLIEEVRNSLPRELPMLETLREKFGEMRRKGTIQKTEILVVATEQGSNSRRSRPPEKS